MVNSPEQPMKNLSLGNSSANEASTTPSAKSRLARLGVPFQSDPAPSLTLTLTPTPTTRSFSTEKLIASLNDDSSRELSLLLLCKVRTSHENLGSMLWDSNGTIFALLKEIMHVYDVLSTPLLTEKDSNRVCNVLALLQCVASHPDTRKRFMDGNCFLLLSKFMADVVNVLLEGDIVSKLLLCLEVGNLLSKTVAAFIFERLLTIGHMGQMHCCASAQRFFSITRVLEQKIEELVAEPCQRLLKHIICCYIKLSENPRACDGLVRSIPMRLKDGTFLELPKDDPTPLMGLQPLIHNVTTGHRSKIQPPPSEAFSRSIKGKAVIKSPMQARSHSK